MQPTQQATGGYTPERDIGQWTPPSMPAGGGVSTGQLQPFTPVGGGTPTMPPPTGGMPTPGGGMPQFNPQAVVDPRLPQTMGPESLPGWGAGAPQISTGQPQPFGPVGGGQQFFGQAQPYTPTPEEQARVGTQIEQPPWLPSGWKQTYEAPAELRAQWQPTPGEQAMTGTQVGQLQRMGVAQPFDLGNGRLALPPGEGMTATAQPFTPIAGQMGMPPGGFGLPVGEMQPMDIPGITPGVPTTGLPVGGGIQPGIPQVPPPGGMMGTAGPLQQGLPPAPLTPSGPGTFTQAGGAWQGGGTGSGLFSLEGMTPEEQQQKMQEQMAQSQARYQVGIGTQMQPFQPGGEGVPGAPGEETGGFPYPEQWQTATDIYGRLAEGMPAMTPEYAQQAWLPYKRQAEEGAMQARESAGMSGMRWGTPLAGQMESIWGGAGERFGSEMERMRMGDIQNQRMTMLGAAGGLGGLGGQYAQLPLTVSESMMRQGFTSQQMQQQELDRQREEWLRQQPEYSPYLPYMGAGATGIPTGPATYQPSLGSQAFDVSSQLAMYNMLNPKGGGVPTEPLGGGYYNPEWGKFR